MSNDPTPEFIESTAGQVAAELARRGIPAGQRVLVAIEPDDWLARVRAHARLMNRADPLSDDELDRLIDEERRAVHLARE